MATETITYDPSNTSQTWEPPDPVDTVTVTVHGPQGGTGDNPGGPGGEVIGEIDVSTISELTLYIGEGGENDSDGGPGGWGYDDGDDGTASWTGGGAGSTAVLDDSDNLLMESGGGGGSAAAVESPSAGDGGDGGGDQASGGDGGPGGTGDAEESEGGPGDGWADSSVSNVSTTEGGGAYDDEPGLQGEHGQVVLEYTAPIFTGQVYVDDDPIPSDQVVIVVVVKQSTGESWHEVLEGSGPYEIIVDDPNEEYHVSAVGGEEYVYMSYPFAQPEEQ